jgi:hypothetical protein
LEIPNLFGNLFESFANQFTKAPNHKVHIHTPHILNARAMGVLIHEPERVMTARQASMLAWSVAVLDLAGHPPAVEDVTAGASMHFERMTSDARCAVHQLMVARQFWDESSGRKREEGQGGRGSWEKLRELSRAEFEGLAKERRSELQMGVAASVRSLYTRDGQVGPFKVALLHCYFTLDWVHVEHQRASLKL